QEQLFATMHVELSVNAPEIRMHRVRRQPEPSLGVFFRIRIEHRANDAALAGGQTETARERAPFTRNEHGLTGSHEDPISRAPCSHRQTGPSSGYTTSPTCTKPHFVSTRVDVFHS